MIARLRTGCLAAVLSLAVCSAASAEKISIIENDGLYTLTGTMQIHASSAVAWDVLTDYQDIHSFVKAMDTDSIERLPDGSIYLNQSMAVGTFPFRRKINLKLAVTENPTTQVISFHDALGQDFRGYQGTWQILSTAADTCTINYSLTARFRFSLPAVVTKYFLQRKAVDLMDKVKGEMVRRSTDLADQKIQKQE